MAHYEAVLFDFDGVLVDSEPVHWQCWHELLTPIGIQIDWETYRERFIGVADREMLAVFSAESGTPLEQLTAMQPAKRAMIRERMTRPDAISTDTKQLISDLGGRYKVAVVTSSGRTEIEPILEATAILPLLDTIVYGNDVANLKPAPDPYLLAKDRLTIQRGLVVEDSLPGITAARAAGLDVLELRSASELAPAVREALNL